MVLGVGRVLVGEVVLRAEGVDQRAVSISSDDGGLAGREWRVDPSGEVAAQVAIVKEMTGRNRAAQLEIVKQMSRQ